MERITFAPRGSSLAALIDQDVAHIARVMRPSLHGGLGGPILSAHYWRKRLHQLLDSGHLSHAQLCAVDSLLLQLDRLDLSPEMPAWDMPARTAPVAYYSSGASDSASL